MLRCSPEAKSVSDCHNIFTSASYLWTQCASVVCDAPPRLRSPQPTWRLPWPSFGRPHDQRPSTATCPDAEIHHFFPAAHQVVSEQALAIFESPTLWTWMRPATRRKHFLESLHHGRFQFEATVASGSMSAESLHRPQAHYFVLGTWRLRKRGMALILNLAGTAKQVELK